MLAHLQCIDGVTQQLLLGQLKGKVFVKVVINFRLIKTYALVPQSNRMGVLLHGQSFTVIIWLRGVRRWRFRYRYALVKSRHKEIITDITPRAKVRARTYNNDNSINVRTVENVETSGPKKGAWFFVARNPYKVVKIALQMEDVHFCGDLRMALPPTMVGLRRDSFPGDPSAVKGGWIGPVVEKMMASFPSYFVVERSETSSA